MASLLKNFSLTDIGLPKKAYGEIALESIAQLKKWGHQSHNILEWLAILLEEVGELSKAIVEYWFGDGKLEDIEKEAIQVSTLALKLAWMIKQHRELEIYVKEFQDAKEVNNGSSKT